MPYRHGGTRYQRAHPPAHGTLASASPTRKNIPGVPQNFSALRLHLQEQPGNGSGSSPTNKHYLRYSKARGGCGTRAYICPVTRNDLIHENFHRARKRHRNVVLLVVLKRHSNCTNQSELQGGNAAIPPFSSSQKGEAYLLEALAGCPRPFSPLRPGKIHKVKLRSTDLHIIGVHL